MMIYQQEHILNYLYIPCSETDIQYILAKELSLHLLH